MQAYIFSDVFSQIESRINLYPPESGFYDPSARVAAISTVDKGIDAAQEFLRSLFTCRNTLVPISVLPPEILARVFHVLVLEDPPFTENFNGRGYLGWIKATHVCQHWRQVALDDLSLWTKIWAIPRNTMWISEMLARAKNAPLDVELTLDSAKSSQEALLMITSHISHTRQLRFYGRLSTHHFDSLRGINSCEAPALEHFELKVDAYMSNLFQDLSGKTPFKGHLPRLRTFSISQVVIPWSLIPRGQLTRLKIACPMEAVDTPGDINELIDLLINCPSLEILALESSLPFQLTRYSHGRTIHLPHLSRLRLCGSTSRVVNMLKMLKLPLSATLHLDCISDDDSECPLLPVISAHFQGPSSVEFKSLTVAIRGYMTNSLNIKASTIPPTLENRQPQIFKDDIACNPELVLSFDRLSRTDHSAELLKQACKMLPISNLESITMSANDTIDINWVELFSCCTNVTTMQAIGSGSSGFVGALTAPTVTNAESGEEGRKRKQGSSSTAVQPASTGAHAHEAIFPKLKHLVLFEVNFFSKVKASCTLFDIFERGLEQRMAASRAPLTLHIINCDISTEHANDLGKLVQDFHFAEAEGWSDDSDYERSDASLERHFFNNRECFIGHSTALHGDSDWYDDDYPDMDYDEI